MVIVDDLQLVWQVLLFKTFAVCLCLSMAWNRGIWSLAEQNLLRLGLAKCVGLDTEEGAQAFLASSWPTLDAWTDNCFFGPGPALGLFLSISRSIWAQAKK